MKDFISNILAVSLLLCVALTGCRPSQSEEDNHSITAIKFEALEPDSSFTDHFSKISCVQLEMTPESVLGRIKKVIVADSTIVVITYDDSEITAFRKEDGKFLNHIGSRGEGPEEYLYAEDIIWDPKSKNIIVCDRVRNTLLSYKLDGSFVGRREIESDIINTMSMERASDGSIILSNELSVSDGDKYKGHAFTILTGDGEIISCAPFAPLYVNEGGTQWAVHPISACEDELKFVPILSDTIYSFKDGKISALYCLDTKYKTVSKEELAQRGPFDLRYQDEAIANGQNPGIDMLYETSRYLVYIPQSYYETGSYWIDKTTGKGIFISATWEFIPEIRKMLEGKTIYQLIGSDDKRLITKFDANTGGFAFAKALEDGEEGVKFPGNVISTLKNIDREGNPFLIIYEH